jgi:hypothetical protein
MASDNVAILFIAILLDCGIVRLQSSSGLGSSFDLDVFAGVFPFAMYASLALFIHVLPLPSEFRIALRTSETNALELT